MKKFAIMALMGLFFSTAAYAVEVKEVHDWEGLEALTRTGLKAVDQNGNPTTDGGRLGYLKWGIRWRITDDWDVYSESPVKKKTGEFVEEGAQFYAFFVGGKSDQTPTTPTTPTSDDQKVEPIEVETFEELAEISSTPLVDNGDEGRGATLTRALKVGPGQKVLCGSDTPLEEGAVVPAGQFIYMWLAEEGYGLAPVATLDELKAKGNLIAEEDGIWFSFSPDELVKFSSADIRAFDMNDFGNEVEDRILRKDGAYRLFLKESFKKFVPKTDEDLKVLAHPITRVEAGPVWTPEGRTIRNYYVVLASEWEVKDNTDVLYNSQVNRATGEVIPAGGKMLVNVTPIADPADDRSDGNSGSGDGGGGGCDSGMGSFALLAVAVFLLKKGR